MQKVGTNQLQPALKKKKINQEAKRVRKLYQENISMNVFSSIIAGINLHKIHLL